MIIQNCFNRFTGGSRLVFKTGPTPAAPAAHPPVEAKAAPGTETGAKRPPIWPIRMVEKGTEKSWDFLKGITGFFGRRIKGVIAGVWEATGEQVTGEISEVGKRLGYESKEKGIFNTIAGVIETTMKKVGNVVGGVIDYSVGLPGRVLGRPLRGAQTIVNSLLGREAKGAEAPGTRINHGTEPANAA